MNTPTAGRVDYIATFGQGYTLADNFVRIPAESYSEAHVLMANTYGLAWAFLYDSEEAAGVERFSLTEVPFGTPNERR